MATSTSLESVPDLRDFGSVYLALNVAGQLGLFILVVTFIFGKDLYRHPTLVNFCVTWILYSVVYSLFLYGARDYSTVDTVCFIQGYLVHGASPMCAVSGLLFIMNIAITHHKPRSGLFEELNLTLRLVLILSPPYIVFLAFSLAARFVSASQPGSISPQNGLYCTVYVEPFRRLVTPVFTAAVMLISLGFQSNYHIGPNVPTCELYEKVFPLQDRKAPTSLIIRLCVFVVYSFVATAACFMFFSDINNAWPYMIPAALPLAAFVVFGTQEQTMVYWFPFLRHEIRQPRQRNPSEGSTSSQVHLQDHENIPVCTSPVSAVRRTAANKMF